MKRQYKWYLPLLLAASTTGAAPARLDIPSRASQTTEFARKLVLQKLESISSMSKCRLAFDLELINLDRARSSASPLHPMSRFGTSPAGCLRTHSFSGIRTAINTSVREKSF
jgi:hypothetical protein